MHTPLHSLHKYLCTHTHVHTHTHPFNFHVYYHGGFDMLSTWGVTILEGMAFWSRCSHVGGSTSLWGWALKLCPMRKSQFLLAAVRSRYRTLSSFHTMPAWTQHGKHAPALMIMDWTSEPVSQPQLNVVLIRVVLVMVSLHSRHVDIESSDVNSWGRECKGLYRMKTSYRMVFLAVWRKLDFHKVAKISGK